MNFITGLFKDQDSAETAYKSAAAMGYSKEVILV